MAQATSEDVETSLLRPLTDAEKEYVDALIARAENLIKVRIPKLSDRCADNTEFASLVAQIEAESVARVLRADNSGIYKSETEGNYSYQLNLMVASGLLDILPAEWERLLGGRLRTVAPAADGYARARYGTLRPDLNFQYGWPACDMLSESWGGEACEY